MSQAADDVAAPAPPAPSLLDLFLGFAAVASLAFGGVLPWARYVLVEKRGWLTSDEFLDMLALCQLLPGPNIGNLSVAVGARFHGAPGAVAAILGLFTVPVAVVLALATLYARLVDVPAVQHALAGMAAAAAGLVVGMALKLIEPMLRRHLWTALPVILGVFAAVGLAQWPLWPVILVAGPVAVALATRRPR